MPETKAARPPIFRSRRLGHVNFFVDDLARSTEFYNSVCGLTLEFVETGLKASFLGTGHTPHDIGCIETTKGKDRYGKDGHLQIPKEAGVKAGLNHLAWEIDNEAELVEGYRRCRAAGLKINRLADHQVAHSIYMQDPDGNMVEFYVDTVKDWRTVLQGELELITTVWNPEGAPPNTTPLYDEAPALRQVAGAPLAPCRLMHAVLASADPARLLDFYVDVAGLERVGGSAGAHVLRGSHRGYDRHLVIVPVPPGGTPGLHHFALEAPGAGAVEAAARGLAERGVTVERQIDGDGKRSLFLRDPDGQMVEFFARAGAPASTGTDPYLM